VSSRLQFALIVAAHNPAKAAGTAPIRLIAQPIVAFTLPRCTVPRYATRHKLGIQMCKGQASRQIETLFEQAAWFERSLRKAVALERVR